MSYHETITQLATDPEQLEHTYRSALDAGEAAAFKQAIDETHAAAPENVLFAAWFYRLQHSAERVKSVVVVWAWAVPLALINGFLFWWFSDERYILRIQRFSGRSVNFIPTAVLLAGLFCACCILAYHVAASRRRLPLALTIAAIIGAATAYVLLIYPRLGIRIYQEQYLNLMALHLPLLALTGVGAFVIAQHRDPVNRFRFLIKALEALIVGGLFAIAGGLFTVITIGLFDALDIALPDAVLRLFLGGGAGVIAVVAPAIVYDPQRPPGDQPFEDGLSKLVALLLRTLLPLTLLVLVVYLAFIPFNFRAPFENRDVLIVYNGMLFAVVVLLLGATPVNVNELSPRVAGWLRTAIIAVVALALLVSLYAFAAILYRTSLDRLTPNRLAFIGWNVINTGLLALLLLLQRRGQKARWVSNVYRAITGGTVAYAVWTAVVIVALPWLFQADLDAAEALPISVQEVVYDNPGPILLKCASSPHIYLLEDGEKRWINTIETFNQQGFVWRDVEFVPCVDLRAVPQGVPIPADAGPPPQP